MDAPLTSALYECEVVHERLLPRRHGFRYHLFFMHLWLDELPRLDRELRLFSVDRFNAYTFRDDDHLDLGAGHLGLNLEKWLLEQHGVRLAADCRIRLVTLPRMGLAGIGVPNQGNAGQSLALLSASALRLALGFHGYDFKLQFGNPVTDFAFIKLGV